MSNLLDKNGYYYAPYQTLQSIIASQKAKDVNVNPKSKISDLVSFDDIVSAGKVLAKSKPYHRFYDFVKDNLKIGSNINLHLMFFHLYRFFQNGAITYKIRKEKVDFLKDITLGIPANLLVLPFNEFMISIPRGCIKTNQGDLLNVYVSQEPFSKEIYNDDKYMTDDNIKNIIENNDIKRIIRCYGICFKEGVDDGGQTNYYQFPVIENQDVSEQFNKLVSSANNYPNKDMTQQIFNLMLNFCAYLSVPNADIAKVMGVTRNPTVVGSKRWRAAQRHNITEAYNHFDVGRIYAERCHSDTISYQKTGKMLRTHKVRRHLRAQWYGEKKDGAPGTEQKIIMIEEFWKGNLEETLKPKIVEVI